MLGVFKFDFNLESVSKIHEQYTGSSPLVISGINLKHFQQ